MSIIDDLEDARSAIHAANSRLEKTILYAYQHRVKVTDIAKAAGLSRMQVNRVINNLGASLRLPPPDLEGVYSDDSGRTGTEKPSWLVANEGSGAVRGWYFREEDAQKATKDGQYSRCVNHTSLGWE